MLLCSCYVSMPTFPFVSFGVLFVFRNVTLPFALLFPSKGSGFTPNETSRSSCPANHHAQKHHVFLWLPCLLGRGGKRHQRPITSRCSLCGTAKNPWPRAGCGFSGVPPGSVTAGAPRGPQGPPKPPSRWSRVPRIGPEQSTRGVQSGAGLLRREAGRLASAWRQDGVRWGGVCDLMPVSGWFFQRTPKGRSPIFEGPPV